MKLSYDSSALIKWVLQEPEWKSVDKLLQNDGLDCVMAGPVLMEVIERSRAKGNRASGQQLATALLGQGLRIESATEGDLIRAAELLELSKANPEPPKNLTLSSADAIILAISERLEAKVLTGDERWGWMLSEGLLEIDIVTFGSTRR